MLDIVPSLYTAPPKTSAYLEAEVVDRISALVILSLYKTLSKEIVVPLGLLITAPPIYCECAYELPVGFVIVPKSFSFPISVLVKPCSVYLYSIVCPTGFVGFSMNSNFPSSFSSQPKVLVNSPLGLPYCV